MKRITLVVAGICLAACSLFSLSSNLFGTVKARATKPPKTSMALLAPGWRLGVPVTYENLTVFPVTSDEVTGTEEFITLDAGLRAGTVKVTEIGASSRPTNHPRNSPRRNHAVQQRAESEGDGAEVNRVMVTNSSGKTLVLIAGEMILGGKQDRIVGHDCIVASTKQPVPIDVFCVEHGRWEASPGNRRQTVEASGASFGASDKVMAAPNVRAKAQAEKSQTAVWDEVAGQVSKNGVSTSTGTLNSVFADKKVSARLEDYEKAIAAKLSSKSILGAVVAINGKVMSADVFASPGLFQAYRAKLLRSYALEAIGAEGREKKAAQTSDAEAFLTRDGDADKAIEKDGVYRLAEKQSASDASFALEHTARDRKLVHYSKVAKQ